MEKQTIELKKGEKLKVVGQKNTFLIIINVDGDIFTQTDYKRDRA